MSDGDESAVTTQAPKPYPFPPSTNVTSPFREIVGVCYQAMFGREGIDPERAIRAFVREVRAEARHRAEVIASGAVVDT